MGRLLFSGNGLTAHLNFVFEVREKPRRVERAFLVSVVRRRDEEPRASSLLEELEELVQNLGIEVIGSSLARARKTYPTYLLGKGKMEEIIALAEAAECDVIVFDNELTPGQQRNWEEVSKLLVIDRHEVILDVFAERARTREAVLQVELARLEYSLPRLRRAWTHLGRQRGGGGVTQRGEGEAQIELDQRMVRDKIATTKRELEQVIRHRTVSRKRRSRVPVPTASIVGYTNAGKSTLLNKLTGSDIYVADKLFATLDPTSRKMNLPSGRGLVLTDTVGFVRNLPHRLVDAFKATLEEALVADFLIHVVDLSSGEVVDQMETTLEVLDELGIVEKKIITVFNKVDLVDDEIERASARFQVPDAIFVSATTGEGLEALTTVFEDILKEGVVEREYLLPHDRYDLVARLRRAGSIRKEESNEDGIFLLASPPDSLIPVMEAFRSKHGP